MAIKKSQLYTTLWESCNALRGSMDASQYKDYVLMMLFVKYLSDKARQDSRFVIIPAGCFFDDFSNLKNKPNIGEEINKKFEAIRQANMRALGDIKIPDFNDSVKLGKGKDMVDTLSKLIGVFESLNLDLGKNRAGDDDLLGDAYEYLMKNFAAESGKSKGQFYTPAEVSRVIAKVLNLENSYRAADTIYDMACGSGSLLLRSCAETQRGKATLYGQEKDETTASLARLNMFLHGIRNATIKVGDTLNNPQYIDDNLLKTFDYCVANPPFSAKDWLSGPADDIYGRWSASSLPPAKNGDYAFLLHLVHSMKPTTGQGACILPHGVLFRGNAEDQIRRRLIKGRVIQGIIGLPANIFFGTGIPASIIIFDNKRDANGIFFIDASKGFIKDGNKNRLREQDIRKIVDVYRARIDIPHYSRFATFEEIEKNEFNLNIPRYIEAEDTEITQNLDGHLNGGISTEEIDAVGHWTAFDGLKEKLFKHFRKGFSSLAIPVDEVFSFVLEHESVKSVRNEVISCFNKWKKGAKESLLDHGENAKALVEKLSFAMRDQFNDSKMIDKYDAFGLFMDYCIETMQDDLYLVCADGWLAAREIEATKKKKNGEMSAWDGVLIPKAILENYFFASDVANVAKLKADAEAAEAAVEQFLEECADKEDDPLSEIRDGDKIVSDAEIKAKLKSLESVGANKTIELVGTAAPCRPREIEITAISEYIAKKDAAKKANKKLREAESALDKKAYNKYPELAEEEIKTLLVDKKWMKACEEKIHNHFENVIQSFASSIVALHDRYKDTLPELEKEVASSQDAVHAVLKEMGFEWNEESGNER